VLAAETQATKAAKQAEQQQQQQQQQPKKDVEAVEGKKDEEEELTAHDPETRCVGIMTRVSFGSLTNGPTDRPTDPNPDRCGL
jgi:hypothetical protein